MQEGDSSSSAAADEPEASASGAAEDGAKRGQIGFPADSEGMVVSVDVISDEAAGPADRNADSVAAVSPKAEFHAA